MIGTDAVMPLGFALGFALFGLDREMEWVPFGDGPILHLGPGHKHVPDTTELEWPAWNAEEDYIPFEYETCGGIIATHFLEHIQNVRWVLKEAARVLKPGCPFNILVPHGQSLSFLQDLDHKTPFVIDTWRHTLNNPYYDKGTGGIPFRVGANFTFAVKEDNTALVTQLIKQGT
jgi:SAM-dependent methyltransferase